MEQNSKIIGVNGPVVTAEGGNLSMLEMVFVGDLKLIGEVIHIEGNRATIQVYESTTGLKIGEPIHSTKAPISLELGPGIIGNVFDGIERPLYELENKTGVFLGRGVAVQSLNRDKKWETKLKVKVGDVVKGGQIIAEVKETKLITHKILVPPDVSGEVVFVAQDGDYTVEQTIVKLKDVYDEITELNMIQRWPVRKSRPVKERLPFGKPLVTGQRVIDALFPLAKGGAAAVPGGFGTGKTMTQHQLAKWSDADIIIYIGCGERGNEITEVLEDFPELIDPISKEPLMERTVLIANTSNMPVAAREASVYTGITLAEYFRDQGYHVAIMADSTSRWAEALREISGRLEEMPAEEGYPAYLPSRLSQFYERAGYVESLCGREGSVSIIGAVSPQGGDFSEPVTQNTKRFVRCFWALDRGLANARHYPAIHWLNSYSEYYDDLTDYYLDEVDLQFSEYRSKMLSLLGEESKLMEIVKLIGEDILPDSQKLIIEITRIVRLGFLQQNVFNEIDTFTPLKKQYEMMKTIIYLYESCDKLLKENIPVSEIRKTKIFDRLIKMKYEVGNEDLSGFERIREEIDSVITSIGSSYSDFKGVRRN